jgi:hypothetical protein
MQRIGRHLSVFYAAVMVLAVAVAVPVAAPSYADDNGMAQVEWLEPHGVSIIDMVGEVPESVLREAIIMYSNNGMLQYLSGERSGDRVTINVRVTPRYAGSGDSAHTLVGCLGQPGLTDSWPVVSPAATMRVYENGVEITSQAALRRFAPGGRVHPTHNTNSALRYPEGETALVDLTPQGEISIPPNRGCAIVFMGYRSNLTATFQVQSPKFIRVQMLGSETFTFRSYIGPGGAGEIQGLADQMERNYGRRHDKFDLTIPPGAEFVLVTFPPTPVHPYVNEPVEMNLQLPGSGTYRIGELNRLNMSVDHAVTAAIPLYWQPRDADQSSGADYLPSFTTPGYLASMEYFVPVGVGYHRCMRNGTCSNELIRQIYNAEMEMTIHYLRIDRINPGLDRIPLRQVGPAWRPRAVNSAMQAGQATIAPTVPPGGDTLLYLPLINADIPPPPLPDEDRSGCPCGWFDGDGRMYDFVPAP